MLNHFLGNISSYDGNVLLAAIVSLLLVILFVLLLHMHAKWFLSQARQRRSRSSVSVSHVLLPAHRFRHFRSFTFDSNNNNTTIPSSSDSKGGLEASLIASIPLFVYTSSEYKQGLECVICLSGFEESDVGRRLPKCGHGFHVECIDMWLHSHSNCPICRAPVVDEKKIHSVDSMEESNDSNSIEAAASVEVLEVVVEREPRVERASDASNCGHEVEINDSLSASGSVASSLKRMLSRNRSDQCKVFPSSIAINVN